MNSAFLMVLVLAIGISMGWMGKTWFDRSDFGAHNVTVIEKQEVSKSQDVGSSQSSVTPNEYLSIRSEGSTNINISTTNEQLSGQSSEQKPVNVNINKDSIDQNSRLIPEQIEGTGLQGSTIGFAIFEIFRKNLEDRLYESAVGIYQEQEQQNSPIALQLRASILQELKQLSEAKNISDFSALVESYLSIYYDDVEALLLLADFRQANGHFLEAVDVYLLAKTYAYSLADQQSVTNRFNNFVKKIDNFYTNQKNWAPLLNLYSHISTSGLITSALQYQQALAHLRSGDEFFAIELLNQLASDTQIGKSAKIALDNLSNGTEIPVTANSDFDGEESIALEKSGNQFVVDLNSKRRDSVKLLIDTGASMTAMSRESFNVLNADGDAVQQDRRVFRTVNGPTTGIVYSVPELFFGPYLLEDTQIAVIDFDSGRNIDGLLGMNILGQFQFQIDQENTRLLLSDKRPQ